MSPSKKYTCILSCVIMLWLASNRYKCITSHCITDCIRYQATSSWLLQQPGYHDSVTQIELIMDYVETSFRQIQSMQFISNIGWALRIKTGQQSRMMFVIWKSMDLHAHHSSRLLITSLPHCWRFRQISSVN